jgi:HEAT repeat protein
MTLAAPILALTLVQAGLAETSPAGPDVVLTAPADGDLGARTAWADRTARDRRFSAWWVGWTVTGDSTGHTWYYIDRKAPVLGNANIVMGSIRITGSGGGLQFDGVPLQSLVGAASPHESVILLRYEVREGGPALERVHTGSYAFPVHFGGGALLWLGKAADDESVAILRSAFERLADAGLQQDLVGAVGAHRSSAAVAPALRGWLENADLLSATRREAASWLGHHPHAESVSALQNVARSDTSYSVRATALRALARAAAPSMSVAFLSTMARDDENARVRQAAISALGTIRDERAFRALVQFVEEPGDSARNATRRQALTAVRGQAQPEGPRPPQEIIDLLVRIARNDTASSVRLSAVESLASLRDSRVVPVLVELAQNHSDVRVQQRATLGLARANPPEAALEPLRRIAWEHPRQEVQTTAVRAMIQVRSENARQLLADIAERHPRPEARRAALQAVIDLRFR